MRTLSQHIPVCSAHRTAKAHSMVDFVVKPDNHLGHMMFNYMQQHSDLLGQIDGATGQEETWQSILSRSIRLAQSLRILGCKPGDPLAIGGFNNIDVKIPYYSGLFNGLPVAGVDPYYKYDEIKNLFEIVLPKVAFCEKEFYSTYYNVCRDLELDTKIITFGNGSNSMASFMEEYGSNESENDFKVAELDVDKIYASLISTSGTTGKVKVAAIKHQPFVVKMMEFVSDKTRSLAFKGKATLNLSPINWLTSCIIAILSTALGQYQLQTSKPDDMDVIINMINKHKPVTALIGPYFIMSLLKRKNDVDLTSFMYIALTGSRVNPEKLLELKSVMRKGAFVCESYAQTETAGLVFLSVPDAPLGSCGKSYPTYIVKLVDPATGREITEANTPGELYVKGPSFTEYYKNPEETAKAFTEDGFYKSGDLLYRDENNFFYFVDRVKTLIKCRNYHVMPSELEEVILQQPGVSDVCVVGVEDPEDGQRPVACVVREPGCHLTAEDIKQLVLDKLSKQKELRGGVVFLKELPLTSTGKVATAKLLEIIKESKPE